jgi:hypothetical protein
MSCTTPITDENLVAYWANDLQDAISSDIEEHLFACDVCQQRLERIARITQPFRMGPPPVISRGELDLLHAQGLKIAENTFAVGVRKEARFEAHLDLLVHHLAGLDLTDAERVDVDVDRGDTEVMYQDKFVPFDAERGEIVIACQRHFGPFPADVVFHVHVHRRAAPVTTASFYVPHVGP